MIPRKKKIDNGFIEPFLYTENKTYYRVFIFRESRFLWFFKRRKLVKIPFVFADLEVAKQFLEYRDILKFGICGIFFHKNDFTYKYISQIITPVFGLFGCYVFVNGRRMQIQFDSKFAYVWYDKRTQCDILDYELPVFKSCSPCYKIDFINYGGFTKEILKPLNLSKNFSNLKDFIKFAV